MNCDGKNKEIHGTLMHSNAEDTVRHYFCIASSRYTLYRWMFACGWKRTAERAYKKGRTNGVLAIYERATQIERKRYMKVIKRDCSEVKFNKSKIENAILKAMEGGKGNVNKNIAIDIASEIYEENKEKKRT